MPELVSIITPIYNSEKFIESAIKSVQDQTYPYWEMILIDDGSTDGSINLVRTFLDNDERIQLISLQENQGPAMARNEGIKMARGRYIAFLDSDDLWLPVKLDKQLKFMNINNSPLSFSAYQKIDENGNIIGQVSIKKTKISYTDLLKTNHIGCLTAMIDTKLLGEKMYMPFVKKRHDHGLWLSIVNKGYTAFGINEVLAQYRCRKNSISHDKINILHHQWKLYREIERLSFIRSMYYMLSYAWYGFIKWIA